MTTPEQLLAARRRRQMLDDQIMDRLELDTPEREDSWVKDFIARLAGRCAATAARGRGLHHSGDPKTPLQGGRSAY